MGASQSSEISPPSYESSIFPIKDIDELIRYRRNWSSAVQEREQEQANNPATSETEIKEYVDVKFKTLEYIMGEILFNINRLRMSYMFGANPSKENLELKCAHFERFGHVKMFPRQAKYLFQRLQDLDFNFSMRPEGVQLLGEYYVFAKATTLEEMEQRVKQISHLCSENKEISFSITFRISPENRLLNRPWNENF